MPETYRAKIRMYRQGIGDCFLITLPRPEEKPLRILIDCGVVIGTPKATERMREIAKDIAGECGERLDVLAVTHEHWDHLSGFLQADDIFKPIPIGEVWMAWTEDPDDALAGELRGDRHGFVQALRRAEARLRIEASNPGADGGAFADAAAEMASVLDFFGASGGRSTADALEKVRGMSNRVRYCRPTDAPITWEGVEARVYVLGPPLDKRLLKKYAPSTSHPETYEFGASSPVLRALAPDEEDRDDLAPISSTYRIPMAVAQEMSFFKRHYWGPAGKGEPRDQSWRRIDGDWLGGAVDLALKLDHATNNTSLALAIELPNNGDVLLFVADAQVGNWLSWQDLEWPDGNSGKVTGPDLLKRTVFYKVGHHGSHNATLREKGLEQMKRLKFAMVPVDEEVAKGKNWDHMPLPSLVDALEDTTEGRLLRSDEDFQDAALPQLITKELYYELVL